MSLDSSGLAHSYLILYRYLFEVVILALSWEVLKYQKLDACKKYQLNSNL